MEVIKRTITYEFFKPTSEEGTHYFIRITNSENNNVGWSMGYKTPSGSVGLIGYIPDERKNALEKEYQEVMQKEFINKLSKFPL